VEYVAEDILLSSKIVGGYIDEGTIAVLRAIALVLGWLQNREAGAGVLNESLV
jgi:hypothetical protein